MCCRTKPERDAEYVSLDAYKGQDITAVVVQQPNFFGLLEDVDAIADWAQANNALLIAVVNPLSLALLKPPGEWGTKGADIVVGDGQPFGVPLSSGGPYFGFMTTQHGARAPDAGPHHRPHRRSRRQAGLHTDAAGARAAHPAQQGDVEHLHQPGFAGHGGDDPHVAARRRRAWRRSRAASQTQTSALVAALTRIKGVKLAFGGPRFHEAVLQLDRKPDEVLEALAQRGIVGGYDLSRHYPELGNALLVCATETRTDEDIAAYAEAMAE